MIICEWLHDSVKVIYIFCWWLNVKVWNLNREQAKVFHYGSISLIVEPCRSAHLKAMEVAREAGCLLSYDPNLRLPLWPSAEEARQQILSIWDKADVIKVSDVELEFLTGSDKIDDASALSLWHPNLKLLLVTLGEHGSRYYTKVKTLYSFNLPILFCFLLSNLCCIFCPFFKFLSPSSVQFIVVLYHRCLVSYQWMVGTRINACNLLGPMCHPVSHIFLFLKKLFLKGTNSLYQLNDSIKVIYVVLIFCSTATTYHVFHLYEPIWYIHLFAVPCGPKQLLLANNMTCFIYE